MIIEKYNVQIEDSAIHYNIKKAIGQVYKLLPMREEGQDWKKPLATVRETLAGASKLISGHDKTLFLILCKLEGLDSLQPQEKFQDYRRTIFQVCNLLSTLNKELGYVNRD